MFKQEVLGYGYYWEGDDPLKELNIEEQAQVLNLARQAAARLQVPFLAVDIGQQENGEWIVIEVGDAQFAGTSQIPRLGLWHRINQIGAGNI